MKAIAFAALASAALFCLAPVSAKESKAKMSAQDVIWPAENVKWEDGPVKGTHVAKLWGDWSKGGPYGVLIKFDAGVMHPLHHHSHALKIVVISGTFVHHPDGGAETKLGPGSYLVQAANKKHVSGCAAGAECEFFMESTDKFDLINDETPAKKK
jgi:hypothetical protein